MLPPESQHLVVSSIPEPNLGEDDEDKDLEPGPSGTSKASAQISGQSDTDITAEFLQPLLTPDNVANLVRTRRGLLPQGREEGSPVFPCLSAPCCPPSAHNITPETLLFSGLGGCGPLGLPHLGWTSSKMIFIPSRGHLSHRPPPSHSSPSGFLSLNLRPTHSLSFPLQGGPIRSINWSISPMTCSLFGVGLALVGWDDQCYF